MHVTLNHYPTSNLKYPQKALHNNFSIYLLDPIFIWSHHQHDFIPHCYNSSTATPSTKTASITYTINKKKLKESSIGINLQKGLDHHPQFRYISVFPWYHLRFFMKHHQKKKMSLLKKHLVNRKIYHIPKINFYTF